MSENYRSRSATEHMHYVKFSVLILYSDMLQLFLM
jgi:hypothetical protein